MVTPLKATKLQQEGAQPLFPGLHVLHTYTQLKMNSSKVSVVVRNMSQSPIFLKKMVHVAHVVSASPVPPTKLSPEMEATMGTETVQKPMSITAHQEKRFEKLSLDGLSNWMPRNAVTAKELVLAFHDIFALEGNEQGCTNTI